ncbi:hypothetical protein HK104_000903 [Borealophlyctis nickersoniae]|nr:hypothetical protein HK104_000903 [Borealophlyctis nickersoniae]
MSNPIKIFVTGATGYVGGSAIPLLLAAPSGKYSISALARDASKASLLSPLGINPIIGTLDDTAVLEKAAFESDVVLSFADSDHLASIEAMIKGLESRSATAPARKPIFIHTSGTGVLNDEAVGQYASDKIYSDETMEDINSVPPTAMHRKEDLAILAAASRHKITTVIVCPPLIYGLGTGPGNRHSKQVPTMIRAAIKNRQTTYAGKGANIWNNVHVEDLADAYMLILETLLEGREGVATNEDGYYFVESGEHAFRPLAEAIGKAIKEKSGLGDGSAISMRKEHLAAYGPWGDFAELMFGGNSRSKAVKIRALGWKPTRPDLFATIDAEVEALLKE